MDEEAEKVLMVLKSNGIENGWRTIPDALQSSLDLPFLRKNEVVVKLKM